MKVIITGGRDYNLTPMDFAWLSYLCDDMGGFDEVITGGAAGADHGGEVWAEYSFVPLKVFPPDWDSWGRAAGPIRNREMIDYAGDDAIVIAFPGGRGTSDMKRQAKKRGLKIISKPNPDKPRNGGKLY